MIKGFGVMGETGWPRVRCPGSVALLVGASAWWAKVVGVDPRSEHVHELTSECMSEWSNWLMFFFSLSSFVSLPKIIKKINIEKSEVRIVDHDLMSWDQFQDPSVWFPREVGRGLFPYGAQELKHKLGHDVIFSLRKPIPPIPCGH